MEMRTRLLVALLLWSVSARVSRAQAPRTLDGARAAALAALRVRGGPSALAPIVADSAELWRRFVRCRGRATSRQCTLHGVAAVTMLFVSLPTPDSATVVVREYRMIAERCPSRTPIVPPRLGVAHVEFWSIRFSQGQWRQIGNISGVAC
jgi:hypothetical protein